MDYLEINCISHKGLELCFPSETQLSALAYALVDDRNRQICFMTSGDAAKASGRGEYASMAASADLRLSLSESLAAIARTGRSLRTARFPVPESCRDLVAALEPDAAAGTAARAYKPLSVLTILLSALEQRNGTLFLIGGSRPAVQKAEGNLRSTFPRIRIVGRSPGSYTEAEEPGLMQALQKATPEVILVGSGVAGGELWVPRHMRYTRSGLYIYSESIMETLAGQA